MKLSIIIPTYNGQTILERNMPFVVSACEAWDSTGNQWEIIIVDDASTDGTGDWLKIAYPFVKILRNQHNLRFGESCNRGVKEARGDIVVLLNNDVQVESTFLKPLLAHFERSETFAVGCKEINVEGQTVLFGGRGVMRFQRGLVTHWRPTDQTSKQTSWVSAGSAAYRRELWVKLGGMDYLFRPAYEEDRDLSWQAVKAGYLLIFEPDSIVTHSHQTTNDHVFGSRMMKIYSTKNQLLFVWKNISSPGLLAQHLFWLPYHLILTAFRTKGLFLVAFFLACRQLPEAFLSRKRASHHWRRSDEEILAMG